LLQALARRRLLEQQASLGEIGGATVQTAAKLQREVLAVVMVLEQALCGCLAAPVDGAGSAPEAAAGSIAPCVWPCAGATRSKAVTSRKDEERVSFIDPPQFAHSVAVSTSIALPSGVLDAKRAARLLTGRAEEPGEEWSIAAQCSAPDQNACRSQRSAN
jgi:hypothetical protein